MRNNNRQMIVNEGDIVEGSYDSTTNRTQVWFRGEPHWVETDRSFREQFMNERVLPDAARTYWQPDDAPSNLSALLAWNTDEMVQHIAERLKTGYKKTEREVDVIEILRAGVVLR